MNAHHNSIIKEEDIFIITKVEDAHKEDETIPTNGNLSETAIIYEPGADPLLFELNGKNCAENTRSDGDDMDVWNEYPAEMSSHEKYFFFLIYVSLKKN